MNRFRDPIEERAQRYVAFEHTHSGCCCEHRSGYDRAAQHQAAADARGVGQSSDQHRDRTAARQAVGFYQNPGPPMKVLAEPAGGSAMKRILLDVDGVLANFAQMAVDWVNNWASGAPSVHRSVSQINTWDILKALGCSEYQDAFDHYVCTQRPGQTLDPYVGAGHFYQQLRMLAEVVIVTSPFKKASCWEYDRRKWLQDHFGHDPNDVIFTSRKELVQGSVLIDDGPHNINAFPGPVVIIDRPWNQSRVIESSKWARVRCDNFGDAIEATDFLLKFETANRGKMTDFDWKLGGWKIGRS